MRTPHWLTPLAICFLVFTGSPSADAQFPGVPGQSQIHTQGLPPGAYMPYPTISPYDQAYMQTYNQNGTWFADSVGAAVPGARNRWTMNVDWIAAQPRKLRGLVGSPDTNRYLDDPNVTPADDVAADADFDVFDFFNYFDAADARSIGNLSQNGLRLSGGMTAVNGTGFVFDITYNPEARELYNPKRALAKERYDVWDQPGLIGNRKANEEVVRQLLTGPDFLAADISPPWDWALDNPPQTHQNDSTESGLLQRNLYNLHGLPIQNGDVGGVTVPYDLGFILEHHHESLNVNLGFAMTPIMQSSGFTMKPIVSGRYMYLGEEFIFRGMDSGLNYTPGASPALFKEVSRNDGVDDGDDKIVDNAGVSDDQGGGGGGGGGAFIGGNASATPDTNWSLINPDGLIESKVNNAVTSHIAGPEVALNYQWGGAGGTLITGQTKVGLMVNREKIDLTGNNIGNLLAFEAGSFEPGGPADANPGGTLTEMNPTNGDGNRFRDEKITTHLSPLFEQSIMAEVPIFSNIPGLRRIRQLEGARFRAGYSFLWIGEVASPNRSINWQANPQANLFPKIRLNRDNYYIGSWNFGINWSF